MRRLGFVVGAVLSLLASLITALSPSSTSSSKRIVLVAGFEPFNRGLYEQLEDVQVFADSDLRSSGGSANPRFLEAVRDCDAFVGSLILDYDDVQVVEKALEGVQGPRLLFECATELMAYNRVGSFAMTGGGGAPPAVKAILSKFGSGKEEDKLAGYLQLLKIGPSLLKLVPGEKARDLRLWLEAYRYWNQGGLSNAQAMVQVVQQACESSPTVDALPELQVTPDVGLVHPLLSEYRTSPSAYLRWRLSSDTQRLAESQNFTLAPSEAPRVALLLYRKHVITQQRYVMDLITTFEAQGLLPIPIFINGVEAHTIVRDLLTSQPEQDKVQRRVIRRPDTYQPSLAVRVDAIVNTIGFPLVGGPAGSMQAGRNLAVAQDLLLDMDVPYVVAAPLLLQSIKDWQRQGVLGLQSVVLYSLPELDGAIDTVVLGGLVGDKIALVPERVRKLTRRVKKWIDLRQTTREDRRIAIALYGFPPNVGAVGTAALLDVPRSLDNLLRAVGQQGYNVGSWDQDPNACGESLVAALAILSESSVVMSGKMQAALDSKMARAVDGDVTVPVTLALPGGGLGGARVVSRTFSSDDLEKILGSYMMKKVRRAWPEKDRGPGVSSDGQYVVAGLEIGHIFIFCQPLLGLEGDPMRLIFERDLTPHPQYCATYKWIQAPLIQGGFGADAIVHFGMHGTVEWLPGQPLGNDRKSWSDELLGDMPNMYVYAANNPSESILAKRRGYGTIVSYNVPPYGRSGLYCELANLKELVDDYRSMENRAEGRNVDVLTTIVELARNCGMLNDVPLPIESELTDVAASMGETECDNWISSLLDYLVELQDRLFSSGLHILGTEPSDDELTAYLEAYFGDRFTPDEYSDAITRTRDLFRSKTDRSLSSFLRKLLPGVLREGHGPRACHEPDETLSLLMRSTEEIESLLSGLDGGYVAAAPGGDLLRDGPAVLPTGRNIHALDPYRMPSSGAWIRGQKAANEILRQHLEQNRGAYPETVAVTLWGLDAIKTRGESVAIALALVGAVPMKEGTGRIVRFDLVPLEILNRPRIDVLASLSGIFRDSFGNIVDLLDDMFERAAVADEPIELNFIKKHAQELIASGVSERAAARLFSNPPGDYGSMVNEVVGSGEWEDEASLGEVWKGRNVYSYGRSEGIGSAGTARPEVLEKLLESTERVVQEIDSVEYGLSDIQEYYANTGALKKAAESRKVYDPVTGKRAKVDISIIEAFGTAGDDSVPVKNVEDVLRLEYRGKLLNPKWRDAMLRQGSGGAYEISQRMTAMIGWSATVEVDNFVFDQAAQRYVLDEEVARQLRQANPEAFKNVVRRLLEASGRGKWSTDEATLEKLRDLYADVDDFVEQGSALRSRSSLV